MGPFVIDTLREILKELVADTLGVGKGNPVEPTIPVMLTGTLVVKFAVDIGTPVERITLVMLMGLPGTVKLGVELGSPVEPMTLVLLEGPISFIKLGIVKGSPVEPMMPGILIELEVAVEGTPVGSINEVKFKKGSVSIVPDGRGFVEKLVKLETEAGIERLGTATVREGVGVVGTEVVKLSESSTVEAEKPELRSVGIGRVIVVSREVGVVKMEMVLRDVRISDGGIEGVATAICVVTPVESVLLY